MATLPLGPYKVLKLSGGGEMPWYMVPFDREGICTGPETRKHLIAAISAHDYTDIYLFSHGWNNDWKAATDRYQSFIAGYSKLRIESQLPLPDPYRPLLIGLFWPSIVLLTEAEQAPKILADGDPNEEQLIEESERIAELASAIDPAQRSRFYELVQRPELTEAEAQELATLLQPVYGRTDDELPIGPPASPANIVNGWAAAGARTVPRTKKDFGAVGGGGRAVSPEAAGFIGDAFKRLLPRDVIRLATVYQMKDRAGRIGASGVRRLLEDVLARTETARLHLLGHSYGGKVLLSALATADLKTGRQVHSMLLLQPAVSHLCFAEKLPNSTASGGYRKVLDRVVRPIFTTYSANDFPLHDVFHHALWRSADKGEASIAAFDGSPPNIYAALGGYGPRNSGEALIDMAAPTVPLTLTKPTRLYGIDGTSAIAGHGDISNPSTWWLSHCASWQ
jgi:Alpha/beta hydrolase